MTLRQIGERAFDLAKRIEGPIEMTTYRFAITVDELEVGLLDDALQRLVDHYESSSTTDDSLTTRYKLEHARGIRARLYLEPQLTSTNTFFESQTAEMAPVTSDAFELPTPEEQHRLRQRDTDLENYFYGSFEADDSFGAWLGGWDAGWKSGQASREPGSSPISDS